MKKILLAVLVLATVNVSNAQTTPAKPAVTNNATVASVVKINKLEHNFGKIKQNKPVTVEFVVTNKAQKPLLIEDATAECGCTKPEFNKAAILKGKTSPIKVTYNAANLGTFTKKVTVKFLNVTGEQVITIKGEVVQ